LSSFLCNTALTSDPAAEQTEAEQPREQVNISTIHAAKGLEWPVVFIPAAYDGSIPHSRSENHDEERRLLYVAMTRAKALLYMSAAQESSQGEPVDTSNFLTCPQVSAHVDDKGPSFTYSVVKEISQILARPCPSEKETVEASKDLPSKEDDQWPLDGSRKPFKPGAALTSAGRWGFNKPFEPAPRPSERTTLPSFAGPERSNASHSTAGTWNWNHSQASQSSFKPPQPAPCKNGIEEIDLTDPNRAPYSWDRSRWPKSLEYSVSEAKRRRLDPPPTSSHGVATPNVASAFKTPQSAATNLKNAATTHPSYPSTRTTMQQPGAFSITTTTMPTGFVSASEQHLRELDAQKSTLPSKPGRAKGRAGPVKKRSGKENQPL
jgi:hypothetical protein